jgi:hypothetical protein
MEQIFIEGFYNVKTDTGTAYLNYTESDSTKSLEIVPSRCKDIPRPE